MCGIVRHVKGHLEENHINNANYRAPRYAFLCRTEVRDWYTVAGLVVQREQVEPRIIPILALPAG